MSPFKQRRLTGRCALVHGLLCGRLFPEKHTRFLQRNHDVLLFKRVRVAVYRAAADGTPLNAGGVEVQSLRTANDAATTQIQSGPLAVMTTDF